MTGYGAGIINRQSICLELQDSAYKLRMFYILLWVYLNIVKGFVLTSYVEFFDEIISNPLPTRNSTIN